MQSLRRPLVALLLVGALLVPAAAAASGYEWRDHAAPFTFEFGNHIDTHQQTLLEDGHLEGFLYITPTGEVNDDGVPIAKHGDCTKNPEGCTVGWVLHGLPTTATYCGHRMGEHPAWAIDPGDMPRQRGFTHFHWMNESDHHDGLMAGHEYDGYVLKLTAVTSFEFNHHAGFLVEPGIDVDTHANVFQTCADWPGWNDGDGGHSH